MRFAYAVHLAWLYQAANASSAITPVVPKFLEDSGIKLQNFKTSLNKSHRALEETVQCDAAFLNCVKDEKCSSCYETLRNEGIDWATVNPMAPCSDILNLLQQGDYCQDLRTNIASHDSFCDTFDACVVWKIVDENEEEEGHDSIDCSTLTKCEWEGMHASFIGDGKCHDHGCYNTAICNYDGGDCCPNTCQIEVPFQYSVCGDEGFYCRDPKSEMCDPNLTEECEGYEKPQDVIVPCDDNKRPFVLNMYDSWGDGWDNTQLSIQTAEGEDVFIGALETGDHGAENICLGNGCYKVNTGGGIWGNEIAWEILAGRKGVGPPIAFGGAPQDCEFAVGTDACKNSCTGREYSPYDEERLSYDKLLSCIADKCMIQLGICKEDANCLPCLTDETPEYCRTNDNYNNLVDCTLCSCVSKKPDYCATKKSGMVDPGDKVDPGNPADEMKPDKKDSNTGECNSDQTLSGSSAVLKYSTCTDISQTTALVSDWNEDNFGPLDEFEACAHSYKNDYAHGGKKALECMRILQSIATEPDTNLREDISALANSLYSDPEHFCDCTAEANKLCPSCNSFNHFKTLLHETLDACMALDEIDCASWEEFYQPCRQNIFDQFGIMVNFNNKAQCDFVKAGCGGVGAYPAFRRLDCGGEISKSSWDFYVTFTRGCIEHNNPEPTPSKPVPVPVAPTTPENNNPPTPVTPAKPNKPYVPSSGGVTPLTPQTPSEPKPYIPYTPSSSTSSSSTGEKKSHGFFKLLVFGGVLGGAYFVYKKRHDDFDFQRYRRQQRMYDSRNDQDMYRGLTGGQVAPSFEPPTLPPAPQGMQAMDGQV